MNSKSLIIERVYSLELTQRATLVAFYLINRADSEGTCFPGVKTIAKECNISIRTVQRALNDLEEVGFLVRESRFHVQGGQRSNLYYLQIIPEELVEEYQEIEETNKSTKVKEILNEKQSNSNTEGKYEAVRSVGLLSINFRELAEECVSRSPCHDGIP